MGSCIHIRITCPPNSLDTILLDIPISNNFPKLARFRVVAIWMGVSPKKYEHIWNQLTHSHAPIILCLHVKSTFTKEMLCLQIARREVEIAKREGSIDEFEDKYTSNSEGVLNGHHKVHKKRYSIM
jgi:hypothetical protein